jgi:hypothetical protein
MLTHTHMLSHAHTHIHSLARSAPLSSNQFDDELAVVRLNTLECIERVTKQRDGGEAIISLGLISTLVKQAESEPEVQVKEQILDTLHNAAQVNSVPALKADGMDVFTRWSHAHSFLCSHRKPFTFGLLSYGVMMLRVASRLLSSNLLISCYVYPTQLFSLFSSHTDCWSMRKRRLWHALLATLWTSR